MLRWSDAVEGGGWTGGKRTHECASALRIKWLLGGDLFGDDGRIRLLLLLLRLGMVVEVVMVMQLCGSGRLIN